MTLELEALPDATAARSDIEAWGYIRPIVDGELEASPAIHGTRDGRSVGWVWFLPLEEDTEGLTLSPHLVAHPDHRGRVFSLYTLIAAHRYAELLGAARMIAQPAEGSQIGPLLHRLGWNFEGGRWICPLPWTINWRNRRGRPEPVQQTESAESGTRAGRADTRGSGDRGSAQTRETGRGEDEGPGLDVPDRGNGPDGRRAGRQETAIGSMTR